MAVATGSPPPTWPPQPGRRRRSVATTATTAGTRRSARSPPRRPRAGYPVPTYGRNERATARRDHFSTVAAVSRGRVLVDLSPLRESDQYRLVFAGQVVSFIGRQFAVVAVAVQLSRQMLFSLAVCR